MESGEHAAGKDATCEEGQKITATAASAKTVEHDSWRPLVLCELG